MKQFLYILFILILSFSTYGQGLNPSLIAVSLGEGTTPPTPPVDDDLFPVLSNFYVDDTNTDRVYFNSSEIITASSTTGFAVTDKTISSINIVTGATTGHYFVVSSAFNFYSNNTIRYEGGSNVQDSESNALHDFTLQFITNNIAEPDASTDRYVTVTGAGSHNGTLGNEWTFVEAGTNAVAGQTVWVKAGNYGNINVTIANTGTVNSPIKFIGYKSSIGDNPTLTREIDLAFDSAEMPLLVGSGSGYGIYSYMEDYIIIKNIQVENYEADMYLRNATGLVFENVYVKDATHCLKIVFDPSKDIRVKDSYIADATAMGIWAYGSHWLIDNTWSVSSRIINMDYHITFNAGSNVNGYNIIRNSYTHSYYDDTHGDHAISIKGEPTKLSEYSLIENCVIENSGMGIEFRHENSKRNVARNNYGTRTAAKQSASDTAGSLVTFRDGTEYNTVENCTGEELSHAIWFNDNYNEEGQQAGGHYNKVINSVFINNVSDISIDDGISYPALTYALEPTNNEFLNNTFYNSSNLITNSNVAFGSTNLIKNCIIESIPSYETSPSFSYSNFYTSFTTPSGTGNISVNPEFTDTSRGGFNLSTYTPSTVYNGGTDVGVYYDKKGMERKSSYSMGADEWNEGEPFFTKQYNVSEYAETIIIPPYDSGNPAHKLISTDADWSDINSATYTHFYVEAGDYINAASNGRLLLTRTGTKDAKRYISLYNGNDLHPAQLNQSQLARIGFNLLNVNYWVIDRMSFWDRGTTVESNLIRNSDNNVFNRYFQDNCGGTSIMVHPDSDSNLIQNCRSQRDDISIFDDRAQFAITNNGLDNVNAINNIFVQNETYNASDGLQLIKSSPPTQLNTNFEGTIIDANHFYIDSTIYTDGSGNHDVNGNYAYAENAIDLKAGSTNPSNPVIVTNNYMAGYREADQTNSNLSDAGNALLCHASSANTIIENNLIVDSAVGLYVGNTISTFVFDDSKVNNNIFKNTKTAAFVIWGALDAEFKNNLIKECSLTANNNTWQFTDSENILLQENLNVSNDDVNGAYNASPVNFTYIDNVYYNSIIGSISDASDITPSTDPTVNYNDINFTTDRFTNNPQTISILKVQK